MRNLTKVRKNSWHRQLSPEQVYPLLDFSSPPVLVTAVLFDLYPVQGHVYLHGDALVFCVSPCHRCHSCLLGHSGCMNTTTALNMTFCVNAGVSPQTHPGCIQGDVTLGVADVSYS